MSTVNEVLNQSLSIMQDLSLKEIVCVCDQALYVKAAEITWKHHNKFQNIKAWGIPHHLHTDGNIGKCFQDAGLRDLSIESGVVAEGSVSGVMDTQAPV